MKTLQHQILEGLVNESASGDAGYKNFMKECQENPTYKKMKSICNKYGYAPADLCYVKDYGNEKIPRIGIVPIKNSRYLPEIYFDTGRYGSDKYGFTVQTTAYGSLDIKEHEKFLEDVTAAHKMVVELSKLDVYTLNVSKE